METNIFLLNIISSILRFVQDR